MTIAPDRGSEGIDTPWRVDIFNFTLGDSEYFNATMSEMGNGVNSYGAFHGNKVPAALSGDHTSTENQFTKEMIFVCRRGCVE